MDKINEFFRTLNRNGVSKEEKRLFWFYAAFLAICVFFIAGCARYDNTVVTCEYTEGHAGNEFQNCTRWSKDGLSD